MIIVNTPQNPVGKVFTQKELEFIAALAVEFNILVMADEVVRTSNIIPQKSLLKCDPSTIIWSTRVGNIFT
jgi:aspartate/methionine/tyrosine aminotransferase